MQKGKSNYERVILILSALVAVGLSAWLIFMSLGFSSSVETSTPKKGAELGTAPIKSVEDAITRAITDPKPWVAVVRANKPVPLNKSVLLVLKDEQTYDLFLDDPQLRPPMSNSFLRNNELEFLSPNVGDLDPDNDGFSNLEEFSAKPASTNPKDAQSHPPITDKLFMVQRISNDYRITLRSPSTPHQVATPDDKRKNWFVDPNAMDASGQPDMKARSFGKDGSRFKAVKFERKAIPDPTVGERDVSELTVEDIVRGNTLVLVMGKEQNLADYEVKFQFRLKVVADIPPVKKGGTFRIPGHESTTYKVIDILEDSAVISPLKADGTPDGELVVKKG